MPVLNWHPPLLPGGQQVLAERGPRVPVQVSVHPKVQETLTSTGQAVPSSIGGFALIDTGATITSIDQNAALRLGLQVVGQRTVGTAAGPSERFLYPFSVRLLPFGLDLHCVSGMGVDLSGQNIIALIGMDLLHQGVLTINGPMGALTLSF